MKINLFDAEELVEPTLVIENNLSIKHSDGNNNGFELEYSSITGNITFYTRERDYISSVLELPAGEMEGFICTLHKALHKLKDSVLKDEQPTTKHKR